MKNLKNKYDVIIVGAGPAGLMAAKVLAENNREVLVIEKNKVIGPKVCGGGLTVKDFELGIPKKLVDRISNKVYIHTLLQNSVIESDKSFIATVDRKKLGQWMKKNLEKLGVKIINDTVDNIKKEKNQIILKSNNILSYNYLIGADGSNSIVRQRLDIPKKKLLLAYQYLVKKIYPRMELFVNVEKFGPWYIWIFPHKNFTSIGTGCDPNIFPAKKNRENFESWLDDQKVSLSDAKYEAWTINYDYRGFEFGNIFLVGDAAGLASGLTGEGMYFAMISGMEAAKKIINPAYVLGDLNHILKIKRLHENTLNALKINKVLAEVEFEIANLIAKMGIFNETIIENYM